MVICFLIVLIQQNDNIILFSNLSAECQDVASYILLGGGGGSSWQANR